MMLRDIDTRAKKAKQQSGETAKPHFVAAPDRYLKSNKLSCSFADAAPHQIGYIRPAFWVAARNASSICVTFIYVLFTYCPLQIIRRRQIRFDSAMRTN